MGAFSLVSELLIRRLGAPGALIGSAVKPDHGAGGSDGPDRAPRTTPNSYVQVALLALAAVVAWKLAGVLLLLVSSRLALAQVTLEPADPVAGNDGMPET